MEVKVALEAWSGRPAGRRGRMCKGPEAEGICRTKTSKTLGHHECGGERGPPQVALRGKLAMFCRWETKAWERKSLPKDTQHRGGDCCSGS